MSGWVGQWAGGWTGGVESAVVASRPRNRKHARQLATLNRADRMPMRMRAAAQAMPEVGRSRSLARTTPTARVRGESLSSGRRSSSTSTRTRIARRR